MKSKTRREQFKKICEEYGVLAAYLFGSSAEAGAKLLEGKSSKTRDPLADMDVGVVFVRSIKDPEERIQTYARLHSELSDIFSPFPLDLIFLQETGVILQFEAISGIPIFSRDDDQRLDYEEWVVKYYQDWKPVYDLYAREVLEAIQK